MKIFVLGKIASITNWVEDCVAGLRAEGRQVALGVTRNPMVHSAIERLLFAPGLGAPLAANLVNRIRRFSPDLILAIDPYYFPACVLERVACLPGRPPLVGWVGHRFPDSVRSRAALMDVVAYTDSALVELHRSLDFRSNAIYLPHAANPHVRAPHGTSPARDLDMIFVGNPTEHRRSTIQAIRTPIRVFGPGWSKGAGGIHIMKSGRVKPASLPKLYARHCVSLNIHNENHVISGLNQRNFQPYLFGTPLLTDRQPDLEACFEEGKEVFVFGNTAELNSIYESLRRSPELAAMAGERGRLRVLRDHTYARRISTLMSQF